LIGLPKEDKIKKQGSIGNKAKPRPALISKAYKDYVIYLLEFLELLHIVHKKSYEDCDITFQYYGAILFKKSDIMQSISSRFPMSKTMDYTVDFLNRTFIKQKYQKTSAFADCANAVATSAFAQIGMFLHNGGCDEAF
jgi:hypothetical protein